jgi:DNA-binding response OmpR family regulator
MTTLDALQSDTLCDYRLIILIVSFIASEVITGEVVELCRQIRHRFSNPLLVVIPPLDEECLLQIYDIGVDDCITSPIEPELLAAKVKSWLRWSTKMRPGKIT